MEAPKNLKIEPNRLEEIAEELKQMRSRILALEFEMTLMKLQLREPNERAAPAHP
jgi:hypothetical protein